jgi:hypothetical protein
MAQHDYIISNATFPAVRTDINNALSAIQTTNSGTSRPTGAVAGQLWLDTTSATTPTLKYYDGADDISLATIDHTANTVNWLDSTVSITGLSTTATGTVLTLSDSASTSTVNLIIDNQKEVRFRETTANGTNYVAFKAPASLSADVTFQLPSADGTNGQALITNGSGVLSFTTVSADGTVDWDTTVKTSGFTATANKGYFCNTTSSAFTVTLPSSPNAGDEIVIVDYAGTFATNNLNISATPKINASTNDVKLTTNREATRLVYIDSTQGYVAYSGVNEGTAPSLTDNPPTYSADFLVVAGGGGGGYGIYHSGGGGAGGYRTSTQTVTIGNTITVTVGGGGAGGTVDDGANGSNSSISGSGLTTITSAGGGGGSNNATPASGNNGGSGGGAGYGGSAGIGNTPSTSPSQGNNGGDPSSSAGNYGCGGGGGASAVGGTGTSTTGGNGGAGTASSITGSSVTRAGGGGGSTYNGGTPGSGGTGGGGAGSTGAGTSGTANTGGGGGGAERGGTSIGGNGGSGVVILSVPTANYSSTTTGSPTVTTSGSNTILQFNGSGSYTA